MTRAGFGAAELARVPSGVSVPLRDALQRCKRDPPAGWPAAAYSLIGRDDLAGAAAGVKSRGIDSSDDPRSVDVRMRAVPGGFLGDDAGAGDDDRDADGADDGTRRF